MPINSDASKESAILTKLKVHQKPLVERMDKTFSYFRGDKFEMPVSEGKWDNVTSNRAQRDGWKMMNILGGSRRSIFNESNSKDDSRARDKLNYNELLVNGLLFNAERMRDGLPLTPALQYEVAFYRVARGWGSYRLLVMEDDDGYPYLDLVVWDTRNVNYISGRNGLLKAYYERSVMKAQAEDEYPGFNGNPDDKGMVRIIDVWDCSVNTPGATRITKEAVIAAGEYVKDPEPVKIGGQKIGWLPVRIKAGGPIPLVSEIDNDNTDNAEENIARVGEDFLVNNRDLLDIESRLLTYHVSAAGEEAGEATILEWDSTKGEIPPEWEPGMRSPRGKKSAFPIDVGKGQKVGDLIPQARGNRVQIAASLIDANLNQGGLNPIAAGQGMQGETAFGVDIRNHNTREHLDPFRRAMEDDFVWMATETVKQFKLGSFKVDKELGGYDSKGTWKSAKIDPDKIDEKKMFKCKLISDELRDKASNAGLAIQLVEAGLLPKREALDDFQLSDDPDGSIETMAQETAETLFDTPAIKGYLAMREDYLNHPDEDKKVLLKHALMKLLMLEMNEMQQLQQAASGGQGGGNGENPAETSRRVTARRAEPTVPRGVQ